MTIKKIVMEYLEKNDYDGLYSECGECACKKDDLFPCGNVDEDCKPGYLYLGDDDYDFLIKPERESIDTVKEKY